MSPIPAPKTPLEWIDKVSMEPRAGSNWRIESYLNTNELGDFTADMANKELFEYFIFDNEVFKHNPHRTFMFFSLFKPGDPQDLYITRRLTRLLFDYKAPIYWKENGMGYSIHPHGGILRKWKLNDKPSS